jgi:ACT domain-containing protein
MEKELLFITVIGTDRKGIVAKISNFLFRKDINIEDINQRIMGDGYFVMTMLVDIKDTPLSMDKITKELEKIGKDLEVKVQLQHENIFKMMHRV